MSDDGFNRSDFGELLKQAQRARRLAADGFDAQTRDVLLQLADEYEAAARAKQDKE